MFQIIETDLDLIEKSADRCLAKGLIERVGSEALVTVSADDKEPVRHAMALRDHHAALDYVLRWIVSA